MQRKRKKGRSTVFLVLFSCVFCVLGVPCLVEVDWSGTQKREALNGSEGKEKKLYFFFFTLISHIHFVALFFQKRDNENL